MPGMSSRGCAFSRRSAFRFSVMAPIGGVFTHPPSLAGCSAPIQVARRCERRLIPWLRSSAGPNIPVPIGEFSLIREVRARVEGLVLAVYVVRSPWGMCSTVVVIRPSAEEDAAHEKIGGLTPREAGVARLMASGLSTKAIASELGISPHTARHHTERVFAKLGVRSRAAAAALVATRITAPA